MVDVTGLRFSKEPDRRIKMVMVFDESDLKINRLNKKPRKICTSVDSVVNGMNYLKSVALRTKRAGSF